jgi:hypothetical protein
VLADSKPPDKTCVIDRMTKELVLKRNTVCSTQIISATGKRTGLPNLSADSIRIRWFFSNVTGRRRHVFDVQTAMTGNAKPTGAPPDLIHVEVDWEGEGG